MNPKFGLKQLLAVFAGCAAFYFLTFYGIETLRTRKGPWQVTFTTAAGTPAIVINQPKLGIQNLRLEFTGETLPANFSETISFATARAVPFDVPFGQCVFLDTTALPGNTTLQMFGHEIQLLPRMLTIDRKEQPWQSGKTIPILKPAFQ